MSDPGGNELEPRIQFPEECPRCKFKHAKGRACPKCADTLDLDTAWAGAYGDEKKRAQSRHIQEFYRKQKEKTHDEEG